MRGCHFVKQFGKEYSGPTSQQTW